VATIPARRLQTQIAHRKVLKSRTNTPTSQNGKLSWQKPSDDDSEDRRSRLDREERREVVERWQKAANHRPKTLSTLPQKRRLITSADRRKVMRNSQNVSCPTDDCIIPLELSIEQ